MDICMYMCIYIYIHTYTYIGPLMLLDLLLYVCICMYVYATRLADLDQVLSALRSGIYIYLFRKSEALLRLS
jgi:hypothetical protein